MDIQNSLKIKENNLCSILGVVPICNGSCKVSKYFSDKSDYFAKGIFDLQAGPPKEIILCYGNPYFKHCSKKFAESLDLAMDSYLLQTHPRIDVVIQKPSYGITYFDFSDSLRRLSIPQQSFDSSERKTQEDVCYDPLSINLRRFIKYRKQERVQNSPLRFVVYTKFEDRKLAEGVVRVLNQELDKEAFIKPVIKIVHGLPVQYEDSYTIDLDFIIHEVMRCTEKKENIQNGH